MNIRQISEFIKQQREEQNISQLKLAHKVFEDERQAALISLIERGKRPGTSYELINKIVSSLGFNIVLRSQE